MSIAYDSVANSTALASTSVTYSLNNVAGDVLIVGVVINDNTATTSSVTYAGVSMTKAIEFQDSGSSTTTSLWYLASPATGSNNVVATISASNNINSGAISFSGGNVSSPIGASTSGTVVSGTSNTLSLTTTFNNSIVVDCWGLDAIVVSPTSTGSNQTDRWTNATTRTAFGSSKTTTTAGSQTMSWTWTNSAKSGGCLLEVRELGSEASTAVTPRLLTLNVG